MQGIRAWPTPRPRVVAPNVQFVREGRREAKLERRQVSISIALPGLGGTATTTTADSGSGSGSGSGSSGGSSADTGGSTQGSGSGDSAGSSGAATTTAGGSGSGSGSSGTTTQGSGSGSNGSGSGSGSTQASSNQGSNGGGVATATVVTSAASVQTIVSSSTNAQGQVARVTVTSSQSVVTLTSEQPGATGASANGDRASTGSSTNGGLIGGVVGGVVGGLALLVLVGFIAILWRRRRSRTGHGWFLCFGRKPSRKHDDLDVDWPTFDPTSGAAGVGGTMGAAAGGASGRNAAARNQGTLPDVDAGDEDEFGALAAPSTAGRYSRDEMRDVGSGGYAPSAAGYYSGHGNEHGSETYPFGSNETSGYGGAQSMAGAVAGGYGSTQNNSNDSGAVAPDYGHLDPPEVREQRAREHAEAMAAYNQGRSTSPPPRSPPMPSQRSRNNSMQYSYGMSNSPPPPRSPPPQLSNSPPPYAQQQGGQQRRPSSRANNAPAPPEHRFSSHAGNMFGSGGFWNDGDQFSQHPQQDDDAGTVVDGDYQGGARRLHLLNP